MNEKPSVSDLDCGDYQLLQVSNSLDLGVNVYSSYTNCEPDPASPSLNPADYLPTYTLLGKVSSGGSAEICTILTVSRIVITRDSDDFPVKLCAPNLLLSKVDITVTPDDMAHCEAAWGFYQTYMLEPFSPISLQFNDILLNMTDVTLLPAFVGSFFQQNGYTCGYNDFVMVGYWAMSYLTPYAGTYYCYEPSLDDQNRMVTQDTPVGSIVINPANWARYTDANDTSGMYTDLYYGTVNNNQPDKCNSDLQLGQLASEGATTTSGILLTGLLCGHIPEGETEALGMVWMGVKDGKDFIASRYQQPPMPFWVSAYDMAYVVFLVVQFYMQIDMAISLLRGSVKAIQYFTSHIWDFYSDLKDLLTGIGQYANRFSTAAGGGADIVEAITTDVDTDIIDVVDIDTVEVEDIDTVDVVDDVEIIDTVVDVDDDIFAFIDIDDDTIIDIDDVTDIDDYDVVDTDIVEVTDTMTDIDTAIPDVVKPGVTTNLMNKIGHWITTKGYSFLFKNLAIMVVFQSIEKVLEVWEEAAKEELLNFAPPQLTGLGLLVNYMLNPNNSEQDRWTTFADFVQQIEIGIDKSDADYADEMSQAKAAQLQLLATITMTPEPTADQEANDWRWTSDDENNLLSQMSKYQDPSGDNAQYKAYSEVLAKHTQNDSPLPVKVACSVATRYLS